MSHHHLSFLVVAAAAAFGSAHATPVTLIADKMATIALTPDLHGPNGTNPGLQYSIADAQGPDAAADPLMHFNLAALAGGRILDYGVLTMTVSSIWTSNSLTANLQLYVLNQDFDPATVTYNNHGGHAASAVATAVGRFSSLSGSAAGQTVSFRIDAATLQGLIDRPASNHGFFLGYSTYADLRGHSDIQWNNTSAAPSLALEVPEPTSLALVGCSLAMLNLSRRRPRA